MNLDELTQTVRLRSGTYVAVRPGLTIYLAFPEPIQTLGPWVASIIERYAAFIKPDVLGTYLASNGAWKPLSSGVLSRDLKELGSIPPDHEFVEYHYGDGEPGNAGAFGVHFAGSHLQNGHTPLEENAIFLQFPHDFLERRSREAFIGFVADIAGSRSFGSGTVGYGFQQLYLTHRSDAYMAIGSMASRYVGVDINSDVARRYSRGRVSNVAWLTLLGAAIVDLLGGEDEIRRALPPPFEVRSLPTGLLIAAAEHPIVGDVESGAEDARPLRVLATLTRRLRIKAPNLGPPGDEFASRWLSRFD